MAALTSRASGFVEGLLYRGREGHLSFIGHRLAGLGTLLFLTIHIVDTASVYYGRLLGNPELYLHAIGLYRTIPLMLGEIVLVAAVLYHGVNGLKLILYDFFPNWWTKSFERQSFWKVAVITFILWVPAAFLMGRSLYLNNICRCGPEIDLSNAASAARAASAVNLSVIVIPIAFFAILGILAVGGQLRAPAPDRAARAVAVPRTLDNLIWQFMRWSGLLLIPLVWVHVAIQDVLVGVHAIDLNFVALRWATWGWRVYDLGLLGFAFGHAMLGLRNIANEYITSPRWNAIARWVIALGWVVVTAIGAVAIIGGVMK